MWRHSTSFHYIFISDDKGGPSSSEVDVLVYDEEELPLPCGFTGKFKFRNCDLELYI